MEPLGYVVLQHSFRPGSSIAAYAEAMMRIPAVYRESVLGEQSSTPQILEKDPHCLALLKSYSSLLSLAQEARKPMFFLKPADGALGGHAKAVQDCYRDFRQLAVAIHHRAGILQPLT